MGAVARVSPRPPGPRTWIGVVQALNLRRDMLGFLTNLQRTYGDVAYVKLGPTPVFLLSDPDDIQDVLVRNHRLFRKGLGLQRAKVLLGEGLLTSEGAFHQRQRRLLQPAFARDRVSVYSDAMVQCATRMADRWTDGATVDAAQEMMRLALAIVGRTLFDADVENEADEVRGALQSAMRLFPRLRSPLAPLLDRLPLPSNRAFEDGRGRLENIIYGMIQARRRAGADRGDVLSILLSARDDDGSAMTDVQVRDEALTLFLAGHETTANVLAWTWYLLAQHAAAEARLHAEVDAVLAGAPPTIEDLPRLPYTRMVIAESMRLYPPAYVLGREALQEYPVGEYCVPAGAMVLVSQWVVHRDPRHYPDPEHFDPERFTPQAQANRHRFAYFPFGGGSRVCIGEQFAWTEAMLVLATLAQRWRLRLAPDATVRPAPFITLRPKDGVPLTLERRA